MKDFKPIDETAESIEKRMTFIQEFLQKKYGFGILYFVLIGFSIWAVYQSNEKGKEEGAKSSLVEIKSLKSSLENRESEILNLKNNITNFQKLYDDCIKKNNNIDLEDEVRKALEKSERLEKILERKILSTEKHTNDLNSIIPKKL